jgi:hypothetical protein
LAQEWIAFLEASNINLQSIATSSKKKYLLISHSIIYLKSHLS